MASEEEKQKEARLKQRRAAASVFNTLLSSKGLRFVIDDEEHGQHLTLLLVTDELEINIALSDDMVLSILQEMTSQYDKQAIRLERTMKSIEDVTKMER